MGLSTDGKNLMLDELATVAGFSSLHTADPGGAGSNEVTGGSPAYARKAITWNPAASGNLDNSNAPVFDIPGSTTVGWFGLWSLSTGGTFYGYGQLGATADPIPFTAEADTDVVTADNHGLADTNTIVFIDAGGSSVLPSGVTQGTIYFVRDATTDTFKVAATSGGVAIDLTVDGAGLVQKIVTETFSSQGTYTLTDADVALLA